MMTLQRRMFALLALAAAFAFAAVSRRAGIVLPSLDVMPMFVAGVTIAAVLAVRLADRRRARRGAFEESRRVNEAARVLPELIEVWLDAGDDADSPEASELHTGLVRRHRALVEACAAHRQGLDPADVAAVLEQTTPMERASARGVMLLTTLVTLQREALVEAGRRGWLAPERAMVIEQALTTLAREPIQPDDDRLTRVMHLATAIYAAFLPLGAAQRLTTVAFGALVGGFLIVLDGIAASGD